MAASKTSGKTGKELAPVMLALITSANKQGIQFTPDEVTLILEILKQGKSKEEQEQIDRTVQMTSSIFKRHRQCLLAKRPKTVKRGCRGRIQRGDMAGIGSAP